MSEKVLRRNWRDDREWGDDQGIHKPIYEKERTKAGGLRRRAFGIVDADYEARSNAGEEAYYKPFPMSKRKDRITAKGDEWRFVNRDYWYDNLLKRVDNVEQNLKTEESLLKYAEKRGRAKSSGAMFYGLSEAGGRVGRRKGDGIGIAESIGI